LYGCDTWPLTLREERRFVVFENRVSWIFGPKKKEVTREWRKLHNEELSDLYSSPSIVRVIKSTRMRLAGHIARMGERRGVYRVLVKKPEGKRPLGRPRRRRRVILRWVFRSGMCRYGLDLARSWYRQAADTSECGNKLSGSLNAGNFLTSWKPVSFSRRTLLHGVRM
jgi:hypothetical protein